MITLHTNHQPLHATLLALAMTLSLGCDTTQSAGLEDLEDLEAVLELSPTQDLVEVEDLGLVAFDGLDLSEAADEPQAFGSGCTLLRPAAWYGSVMCVEYQLPAGLPGALHPMDDGESFITYSDNSGGGFGIGHARISCNDGTISIETLSCFNGEIP